MVSYLHPMDDICRQSNFDDSCCQGQNDEFNHRSTKTQRREENEGWEINQPEAPARVVLAGAPGWCGWVAKWRLYQLAMRDRSSHQRARCSSSWIAAEIGREGVGRAMGALFMRSATRS